jgi:heptosyltransferase-3
MTAILETSGRILVVRGGAIGDFVLTLPVLFALREAKFRVSVVGPSVVAPLAVAGGLADEWCSLDGREWAGMFAERGGCDSDLSDWLAGFELVLSYLHDPDGILERNLKRVTMARLVRGAYRPDGIHVVDRLMQPLDELGVVVCAEEFRLSVPRVELDGSGPWLAVHPGSGSESKNWPEESWRVLLERVMVETGWNVLMIGGEAEAGRVGRLAEWLLASRVCLAEDWPLVRVAGALRCCDVFAGVDSGIRHLAEAVGLPGVVAWSGSDLSEWGPRGDRWLVLQQEFGGVRVEDMWIGLRKILPS